tara:strand:+ start:539 stop:853 length:315 start_codon:yes stop_codon:yes gene_type:complete
MSHEKSFTIYHKESKKYVGGIYTYKNGVKNSIKARHYNHFYQAANFIKDRTSNLLAVSWDDVTADDFEIHEVQEIVTNKFSVAKTRKNEELTPKVIVFGEDKSL